VSAVGSLELRRRVKADLGPIVTRVENSSEAVAMGFPDTHRREGERNMGFQAS
jgi:hypothetical protein